jgi:dihydroxyacetone kinase phosphoprotein-dependent L subunit
MNSLSIQQTRNMFLFVGAEVIKSKDFLTEIDGAIGDGDHGIGMSVGFTSAIKKLNESEFSSINDIFKSIGMAMLNSMGGASGVIFGTMFMGGVKSLPPTDCLNLDALTILMENSLQAIKARGKASLGDKTMIDALEPAAITLRKHISLSSSLLEGLKAAEESARIGVENTKDYISKFGRSKTLGERAVGYQDAGATSVWIIFRSMRQWLEEIKDPSHE